MNNALKANPDKSHLPLNSSDTSLKALIDGNHIPNENSVNLLAVKIDKELNFTQHVTYMCRQATKKLHALSRIAIFMDLDNRRTIMNSFFLSHFSYCPLVWMS